MMSMVMQLQVDVRRLTEELAAMTERCDQAERLWDRDTEKHQLEAEVTARAMRSLMTKLAAMTTERDEAHTERDKALDRTQ